MNENHYTNSCEYCGRKFTQRYTADKDKSTHKATCAKKRFLGGELTMETFINGYDALMENMK